MSYLKNSILPPSYPFVMTSFHPPTLYIPATATNKYEAIIMKAWKASIHITAENPP